ncbi:uncharacterized protein TRAVEDRAFT_37765 [Trametes versicolor FP-101664 SS1]|uniref:uncharacterized protein n=1 Tax=Trametes versicolor (strain FP-101664) TaxID=717944 RepID=UPI0004622CCB|nr:uncharacterized protein TRAVEDRAFT_37765 [Trametes versicolor FP-101664 SS1]EIW57253.1 hypothetical protein TRAVEDRAFT_37765 [Trametes versicolor FP-101664 SS1]
MLASPALACLVLARPVLALSLPLQRRLATWLTTENARSDSAVRASTLRTSPADMLRASSSFLPPLRRHIAVYGHAKCTTR